MVEARVPQFVVEVANASVVKVVGELDASTARELEGALDLPGWVIVDASELTFMDSSGVRTLVLAYQNCTKRGDRLVLVGLSGAPKRVAELTHIDEFLCP